MSVAEVPARDETAELEAAFQALKRGYRANPDPSYAERKANIKKLMSAVSARKTDIARAIDADYDGRPTQVTYGAEIGVVLEGCKHLLHNLKSWMKPRSRRVGLNFKPGRAKVRMQPLGVVGVISPWNYPVQLALVPLATALAAGNRVLLKPSEFTPATGELLREILAETFPQDLVSVVTGGVEVGVAFSRMPFDHLLYTGSTAVGRKVMAAAAENLTPVTLELGGKSPTIVHKSYSLTKAAERIAWGKTYNAGQTCIAPDYVLVHESQVDRFVEELTRQTAKMYPTVAQNPDWTAIINERHKNRLMGYLSDAEEKGATIIDINPAGEQFQGTKQPLRLVLGGNDDMVVMQDEIFGPILPIVPYRTLDEAIDYVNDRPRPLALYYFDNDRSRIDKVLTLTVSGGVSINETLLHCAQEDIPFGGVGPSGMGAYHGIEGFETFSHKKSVFYQSRFSPVGLLNPPYNETTDRVLGFLTR